MKLFDIIKKVGGSVISSVIPGGGLLIDAVNAILPGDKQLPSNATGHEMNAAVETLSSADQSLILTKEFDVEIKAHDTLQVMLESDASNPQSTRPHIALGSFYILAIVTLIMVGIFGYGVYSKDKDIINAITEGWPLIVAITGTFTSILLSYFGNLVREQKNKMDAANGSTTPNGLAGLASMIFKK